MCEWLCCVRVALRYVSGSAVYEWLCYVGVALLCGRECCGFDRTQEDVNMAFAQSQFDKAGAMARSCPFFKLEARAHAECRIQSFRFRQRLPLVLSFRRRLLTTSYNKLPATESTTGQQ